MSRVTSATQIQSMQVPSKRFSFCLKELLNILNQKFEVCFVCWYAILMSFCLLRDVQTDTSSNFMFIYGYKLITIYVVWWQILKQMPLQVQGLIHRTLLGIIVSLCKTTEVSSSTVCACAFLVSSLSTRLMCTHCVLQVFQFSPWCCISEYSSIPLLNSV